jgi:hypothetical protein
VIVEDCQRTSSIIPLFYPKTNETREPPDSCKWILALSRRRTCMNRLNLIVSVVSMAGNWSWIDWSKVL